MNQNGNARVWDNFLNPEHFKATVIGGGIFLISYELLKFSLVDRLKGFFTSTDGDDEQDNYVTKVLSLYTGKGPREYLASCIWFKNNGAISDGDIATLKAIRDHRHEVAHELPHLVERDEGINFKTLEQLVTILKKIDIWWMRWIETDYGDELPDSEFVSGNMILLDLIVPIAHGDDGKLNQLYVSIKEEMAKRKPC